MLSLIIESLRDAQPACVETLAQRLQKDPELVSAMLEELSRMGKVELYGEQGACERCSLKSLCGLPAPTGPFYRITRSGG